MMAKLLAPAVGRTLLSFSDMGKTAKEEAWLGEESPQLAVGDVNA